LGFVWVLFLANVLSKQPAMSLSITIRHRTITITTIIIIAREGPRSLTAHATQTNEIEIPAILLSSRNSPTQTHPGHPIAYLDKRV